MRNLVGEYAHKMDAKGRVSFPANFRKTIQEDAELVVAPSLNTEYLCVYIKKDYIAWVDRIFEGIGGYDPNNMEHVLERSCLMGDARDAEIDAAGRIMISADQRELCKLGTAVVMVGNDDHVEIWDAALRQEKQAEARALRSRLLMNPVRNKD